MLWVPHKTYIKIAVIYGAHRGENGGPLHGQLRRHNNKLHAALELNHAILEPSSDRLLLQPHEQTNASQRNPGTILWLDNRPSNVPTQHRNSPRPLPQKKHSATH